jgi:hypothetical protein
MSLAKASEKSTRLRRSGVMVSAAAAMSPSPLRSRGISSSRATGIITTWSVMSLFPWVSMRPFSNALADSYVIPSSRPLSTK